MWKRLSAWIGKDSSLPLGRRGEDAAAHYLRSIGYKIIQRNFVTPLGEIDIIARDGKTIVFVEVKTREEDVPTPEEQVNRHKQHQLTRVAKFFLGKFDTPPAARFDVVAIVWPSAGKPLIRHTPHAFEATF
jgi:putative endonuclease